jgi:hypothetical protein
VNPHLENTFPHWFAVTKVVFCRAIQTQSNLGFSNLVLQSDQPSIELIRFQESVHDKVYSIGYENQRDSLMKKPSSHPPLQHQPVNHVKNRPALVRDRVQVAGVVKIRGG